MAITATAVTGTGRGANRRPSSPAPVRADQLVGAPSVGSTPGRRPHPRWMRRYTRIVLVVDVATALAATLVAHVLFPTGGTAGAAFPAVLVAFPLAWAVLVQMNRGYEIKQLTSGDQEYRSIAAAGLWAMALLSFGSYAADVDVARGYVVVGVPLTVMSALLGRYAARKGVHRLRRHGRCTKSVVAVGREGAVLELVRQLRREQAAGMTVVGACVPNPADARLLAEAGVPVLGNLDEAAGVVLGLGADAVAVTSSSETAAVYLRRLSWELEGRGVELLVAPGLMEVAGPRMHIRPFVGLPLLHVDEPEFTGARRLVKGAMDRIVAGLVLTLVSPLVLAVAIAIRLDDGGPVFFRQTRIGRGGREFVMFKFRTMVVDAEARRLDLHAVNSNADGLLFKVLDDPRVTRVGRHLRRYSLDEVPQLLNVLLGRMSLVGPRPPLPTEVELYDDSVRRRLLVQPGLTGLWQISGRSDLTWEESVRLDLRYVENWSLLLDVMIMWKTAFAVVRARGAY